MQKDFSEYFAANRFGASGVKRNIFVLAAGGGLWVANVLLLFMMIVRGGIDIWEYVLLQYMEVTYLIGMVEETLEYGCLRWSTDDEEGHAWYGARVICSKDI